jgi:protein-S-isoprenylcysteine O-methyltransferase Ste14
MSASETIRNDTPGVIAPPPLIFLSFLLAGIAADPFLFGTSTALPEALRYGLGAAMALAAAVFLIGALGGFRVARTRAEPWKPTTAIVTGGVYRFTRNPMYVGMALAYAGAALALDSPSALLLFAPALLVIRHGVVLREERYLEAKFGGEYLRYKARVRRWL